MVRHGLEQATLTAAIAGAYLVSFIFVDVVLTPIQSYLMPTTLYGSIAFLPHGVRVLAVALYRWSAAPGILIGSLLVSAYYATETNGEYFNILASTLLALGNIAGPLLAIVLLELGGIDTKEPIREVRAWRFIIVIGAISSVITSAWTVTILAATHGTAQIGTSLSQVILIAGGDTLGVVLLLVVILLARRIWRSSRDMNL